MRQHLKLVKYTHKHKKILSSLPKVIRFVECVSFLLDPMNGLITTLKPLDREQKASYKIIIEVSDHGQPPQAATRVLRINVLDIDDHSPRFVRDIVREFFFHSFIHFDLIPIIN